MTLSRNKIIRGADIDGVVFCTPGGEMEGEDPAERQEKDNLKTLEEFWRSKGEKQGREAGFEQGFQEGEQEGLRKGLKEGEEKGREAGETTGYEKGLEEGKASVVEQLQETIDLLQTGASELNERQKMLFDEATPELVRFSLKVCERVLRSHLEETGAFVDLLKNIFSSARPVMKEVPCDLYLSQEDYDQVHTAFNDFGIDSGEAKSVSLLSDEKLKRGDVKLETPLGLVNFDIERLLKDLEKKTLEVRSDEEDDEEVIGDSEG